MCKKTLLLVLIIGVLLILVCTLSMDFSSSINYSTEYAKVFGSYSIERVDSYLDGNTYIEYNGVSKTYKELRQNIIKAFAERKYSMTVGSSYGDGEFKDDEVIYRITSFVVINDKYSVENYIKMIVKDKKIIKIKSNDKFFGYMFFGEPFEG